MLDEKDLQAIAAMLAEERKHTDEKFEMQRMDFIAYIEAHIDPQIKVLAEGQAAILEKLAPISQIEPMETDIWALKTAVNNLNQRVRALEKAQ